MIPDTRTQPATPATDDIKTAWENRLIAIAMFFGVPIVAMAWLDLMAWLLLQYKVIFTALGWDF